MATVTETSKPIIRTFDIKGLTEHEMEVLHSLLGQASASALPIPAGKDSKMVHKLFEVIYTALSDGPRPFPVKYPLIIMRKDV